MASGWTWADIGRDAAAALTFAGGDGSEQVESEGEFRPQTDREIQPPETGGVPALTDASVPDTASSLVGWEDLGDTWAADGDLAFLAKLALLSTTLAYAAKYLPALTPAPLVQAWQEVPNEALSAVALAVIVVPTLLNCAKWIQRSEADAEFLGDF